MRTPPRLTPLSEHHVVAGFRTPFEQSWRLQRIRLYSYTLLSEREPPWLSLISLSDCLWRNLYDTSVKVVTLDQAFTLEDVVVCPECLYGRRYGNEDLARHWEFIPGWMR